MSLIIETGRLRNKTERLSGQAPGSALEIEISGAAWPRGPLKYDLTVQPVSGELIVRGRLEIEFAFRCARCGENFDGKILVSDFCRSFRLTAQNELINLTPDAREDILLVLPMVAVCSADCRGLCPACGVNLNRKKCKCKRPPKANPWRALDDLRLK